MNTLARPSGTATSAILAAAAFGSFQIATTDHLSAQAPKPDGIAVKVDVDKPEINKQTTPQWGVSRVTAKRAKYKDWIEIEAEFEVETNAKKLIFLPELTFKYYVFFSKKTDLKGGKEPFLTGEVKHVNLEFDEKLWTSVYISPRSVKTLLNSSTVTVDSNLIKAVGIEVLFGEKVVGGVSTVGKFDPKGKDNWWNKVKTAPDGEHLQTKPETPFAPLWYDRYAEVKKK